MSPTRAALGLGQQLGRRLLPVALVIGLLIGTGFPATYYFLDQASLKDKAARQVHNFADQLQGLVINDPILWKYQAPEFAAILRDFLTERELLTLDVTDADGRPIADFAYRAEDGGTLASRFPVTATAPIIFNNRAVGMVRIALTRRYLLTTTAALFVASLLAGIGLAGVTYFFPVRVVTTLGRQITMLLDTLQASQAETLRLNTELEQRVVERTAELQQAKEEAERANHAKSEFLSRMSHELRTPLNAILGFSQLLEMEDLTARQLHGVGHILRAGRHLLELVDEVLDIARIESGRLAISPEAVSVGEVVRETLELVGPMAAQRSIRLRAEHSAEIEASHIMADRQRLKQVLLNLLINAVKYNHEDGEVIVGEEARDGRVRLSVRDTGPGISPDQLAHLFVPFERLQASRAVEGTGLGLALSKRLTEAMGGSIGVESRVGEGSTFWIEFPVTRRPLDQAQALEERAADRSPFPGERGITVLYIEDNLANLELVQFILGRRSGVRILTAIQGRVGLELAQEHLPDLILLDLHLPDMRGDELLRLLHAQPATRAIPVIVISADASPGQVERLRAMGARDYLTKPIDVRRFIAIVDALLSADPALPGPSDRPPSPARTPIAG